MSARRAKLPRFDDRCRILGLAAGVSPYLLGAVRAPDAVIQAYEEGINFFLLGADLHWPLYEPTRIGLRELLRRPGVRDEIVVAALSFVTTEKTMAAAFREALASIPNLDGFDILIAGGAEPEQFVHRMRDVRALLEQGHTAARAAGTLFSDEGIARMSIDACAVSLVMTHFHAGRRARASSLLTRPCSPHLPPLYAAASTHAHHDEEVWQRAGLPRDHWRPAWADYVRYALTFAAFDGVMLELMTPETLNQLKKAIEAGPLDDEELDYLDDLDDLANGRARLDEG